jgi:hypothetical protein
MAFGPVRPAVAFVAVEGRGCPSPGGEAAGRAGGSNGGGSRMAPAVKSFFAPIMDCYWAQWITGELRP